MTADPDYDSEARYRIITGLEDMGLSQVAEGIGAVFKAIDIFQVAKNAKAKVFGGPKTNADAIDESLAALNKELDLTAYKAELKEAEESLRWDDVRKMQKDQILTKIDDLQAWTHFLTKKWLLCDIFVHFWRKKKTTQKRR